MSFIIFIINIYNTTIEFMFLVLLFYNYSVILSLSKGIIPAMFIWFSCFTLYPNFTHSYHNTISKSAKVIFSLGLLNNNSCINLIPSIYFTFLSSFANFCLSFRFSLLWSLSNIILFLPIVQYYPYIYGHQNHDN